MRSIYLTLVAAEVFFAGAFFLVTPTGLLALVALPFFGPLFAPVFAVARFLVVVVVLSGTVGKTRGREFPMYSSLAELDHIYAPSCRNSGDGNCMMWGIRTGRRASTFTRHCFLQAN